MTYRVNGPLIYGKQSALSISNWKIMKQLDNTSKKLHKHEHKIFFQLNYVSLNRQPLFLILEGILNVWRPTKNCLEVARDIGLRLMRTLRFSTNMDSAFIGAHIFMKLVEFMRMQKKSLSLARPTWTRLCSLIFTCKSHCYIVTWMKKFPVSLTWIRQKQWKLGQRYSFRKLCKI